MIIEQNTTCHEHDITEYAKQTYDLLVKEDKEFIAPQINNIY